MYVSGNRHCPLPVLAFTKLLCGTKVHSWTILGGRDMQSKGALTRALAGLCIALALLATGCAQGAGGEAVEFDAFLNGSDVAASEPGDPIALSGDEPAQLELTMRNVSDDTVEVRYVRFEGEVLDMIFLTYDTAVSIELEPGETRTLPPVLLDFYDLGGQASGYLRGHVSLYDGDRDTLGSQQAFLEANGEGFSTLSLFNVLLLAATVVGAGWNLVRLAQRKLPSNRLIRALRFLAVGAGAGLTLAVAFSTLRIWPLDTVMWVLFAAIGAAIGYFIGFVLPGADDDIIDILDEQDVLDAAIEARAGVT